MTGSVGVTASCDRFGLYRNHPVEASAIYIVDNSTKHSKIPAIYIVFYDIFFLCVAAFHRFILYVGSGKIFYHDFFRFRQEGASAVADDILSITI